MKICWIFLSTCAFVAAELGTFYSPPARGPLGHYQDNPVYTLGMTVQMRWYTEMETFSIVLVQDEHPKFEQVQSKLRGVTSYNWIVSTNRNLSISEVFYFVIQNSSPVGSQRGTISSHYFNITEGGSSTSTTSSVTTSATEATASSMLLSPSLTATQSVITITATASRSSQENSGLSNGAKVGMGVGIGLRGAFFAALALFLFLRCRSKDLMQINASSPPPGYSEPAMDSKPYNEQPQDQTAEIFEAPANEARSVFELR